MPVPSRSSAHELLPTRPRWRLWLALLGGVVGLSVASANSVILQQFQGISYGGDAAGFTTTDPPDTHGAVGPSGILASVNSCLAYFPKDAAAGANRAPLWRASLMNTRSSPVSFFAALPGFQNGHVADPKVVYDTTAGGRFFVIQQETTATQSFLHIGVSKTNNPRSETTADWFLYRWEMTWADPDRFGTKVAGGDYPGLAVDARSLYVSYNMFVLNGVDSFSGFAGATQIYSFDATALRSGTLIPPLVYREDLYSEILGLIGNGTNATMQPAQMTRRLDGADPAFAVNLRRVISPLEQYEIRVHRFTGMPSALGHSATDIDIDMGNDFFGENKAEPAPQPGGHRPLDALDYRCVAASYDAGDVWMAWTGKAEGDVRAVVRWARLRVYSGDCCPTTPRLIEDGWVDAGPGTWTFMPAISTNRQGDVCLVFTRSSTTQNPTIYYMLRRSGAASFEEPTVIKASATPGDLKGRPNEDFGRWGDYAVVSPDPLDSTFWVAHEFVASAHPDAWGTWWAQIAPCDPQVEITQQPQSQLVCQGATLTLTAAYSTTVPGWSPQNRWLKDGVPIVPYGDNRTTLTIPNFQAANEGEYSFEIDAMCGTRRSSRAATVWLIFPPVITRQPKDFQTLPDTIPEALIILEVAAQSLYGVPMTYQWYRNGVVVDGATASAYVYGRVLDASPAGRYFCRVTNRCGFVDSNTVTVEVGPRVTTHPVAPSGRSVCGGPIEMTVEAVGVAAVYSFPFWTFNDGTTRYYKHHSLATDLTFIWRHNGRPITPDSHLAISTTGLQSLLRIVDPGYADEGEYDCIVEDGGGPDWAVTTRRTLLLLEPTPPYLTVTAGGPPAQYGQALVFDSRRNVTVLFGGTAYGPVPPRTVNERYDSNETWEWDGRYWVKRTPLHSPPSLSNFGMVFDSERGRVVVFGGRSWPSGTYPNATWEWDGDDWTEAHPATSPPARTSPSMCFDSVRKETLLIGGDVVGGITSQRHTTWAWNGIDWTVRSTSVPPPTYSYQTIWIYPGNAMAFDAARGVAVLFSSFSDSDSPVWEWDGAAWKRVAVSAGTLKILESSGSRTAFYDPFRHMVGVVGLGSIAYAQDCRLIYWTGSEFRGANPIVVDDVTGIPPLATSAYPVLPEICVFDTARRAIVWFDAYRNSSLTTTRFMRELHFLDKPGVVHLPALVSVNPGGTATLRAIVGGVAPLTYRWQHAGTPLANGGRIAGADAATLTLTGATDDDVGEYRVQVDNTCGQALSLPVMLLLNPGLPGAVVAVVNQAATQRDPSATSPLRFDVTFSQPVADFTAADVSLTGTAGATTAAVAGGGDAYTVAVSGMAQSGSVTVTIPAGVVHDGAGNANSTSIGADSTVIYDILAPFMAAGNPLVPGNGARGVAPGAVLNLVFNEAVVLGAGTISIRRAADDSVFENILVGAKSRASSKVGASGSVSVDGATVVLTHTPFEPGVAYYVLVEATCFIDAAGNFFAGITDPGSWRFTVQPWVVSFVATDHGSLVGQTPQEVDRGGSTTPVQAQADTGWHFRGWTRDATEFSTDNPLTVADVSDDMTLTAVFAINQYTLAYTAGAHGSLTGDSTQTVDHGASGTAVEALAATGYHFVRWSDLSTANPRQDLAVAAALVVAAEFAINTYAVTFQPGAHGTLAGGTPAVAVTVNHGDPAPAAPTVTVLASWLFGGWSPALPTTITAPAETTVLYTAAGPVLPNGSFLVAVDAIPVSSGRGLWDLTGPYSTTAKTNPLTLNLVHDATGRLSGTATYTVAKDATVTMPIRGSIKGSRGSLTMKGSLQGADSSKAVTVALTLNLTVDTAQHELTGRLTGRVRSNGTTTLVDDPVVFDLPEKMTGSWTLSFALDQSGRTVTGTAELTLSNLVKHGFVVRGKTGANRTVVLTLAGNPANPASMAISLRTTLTPLAGGWATLESFSGRVYGQVIGW